MDTPILTIQQICAAAGREWKKMSSRKSAPPSAEDACDALTLDILRFVAGHPGASGAQIAGTILAQSPRHITADSIYHAACSMASPLTCRYPLLRSDDVFLPEKAPAMWDCAFSITEIGQDVLGGVLPNCLINGYLSSDCKMPPIRAKSVGEAIGAILAPHENSADAVDIKLGDVDFACPCVVDGRGIGSWTSSGKGSLTCVPNCEVLGDEVHLNMIPFGIEQSKSLETLTELLEDVPGVEECEARPEKLPVNWYRLVVRCKNEQAARSCLEAVLAATSLKSKFKISYVVTGAEGQRVHSNPQEILRGFVAAMGERGVDAASAAKRLLEIDGGARAVFRAASTQTKLGPQVIWAIDSSGRNKVIPLPFIKRQARGGKGSRVSPSDLKTLVFCRVRQRVALFGAGGNVSILDVRPSDSGDVWGHPAETLPEGCQGVCFGLPDSERKFVAMASSQGQVKKMERADFSGGRRGTKLAMKVAGGDSVAGACWADDDDDLVLVTARGFGLRFKLKQVRSMGGGAKGVAGISLKDGDRITGIAAVGERDAIAIFLSDGGVKILPKDEIPLQNRAGAGVQIAEMTEGVLVAGAVGLEPGSEGDFFVAARGGKLIRFPGSEVGVAKRGGVGVAAMEIESGDSVIFAVGGFADRARDDGEGESEVQGVPETGDGETGTLEGANDHADGANPHQCGASGEGGEA